MRENCEFSLWVAQMKGGGSRRLEMVIVYKNANMLSWTNSLILIRKIITSDMDDWGFCFRTVLIANNVCLLSKEANPCITAEDVRKCKRFAKSHGGAVFDKLAHSIAPSIHGHEYIKKAVLCMLLGGLEKHLPNGTRLRGCLWSPCFSWIWT